METSPSGRAWAALIAAIVVVILIIVGCFAYFYAPARNSIVEAWSVIRLPSDLHGATFIGYQPTGAELFFKVQGLKYVQTNALNPNAYAYAHVGTTTVFSIGGLPPIAPSKPYGLVMGTVGIGQDSSPIPTISISPDGNTVAYSVASSTGSTASASAKTNGLIARLGIPFYTSPDGWVTKLFLVLPKKEVVIGNGYSPLFIDATHILLFQPNGVFVLDTVTAKETSLLTQPIGAISRPIQSPDRSLVGWTDTASQTFFLYRVTPTTMKLSASFVAVKGYLVLGNTALYAVRDAGLWELPLTGGTGRMIDAFPSGTSINNVLQP